MIRNKESSLLRNRPFLVVWGGQSISILGSQMSYIALFYWVYDSTGSSAALASVAIASAITRFLAGPLAGMFIDRVDRRRLMLAMNVVSALTMAAVGSLLYLGRLQVWHVYISSAIAAGATLVHRSALLASIPNLVSKEQLTQANSLDQIASGASSILGPAIGGVLVGLLGSGPTMWLDALTFLVAGVSLALVSFASPRVAGEAGLRKTLRTAMSGFRFLYERKSLLCMVGLYGITNFMLAPTSVLFPIMASDVLRAGAEGLGFLTSALSIGMLVGGAFTWLLKRVQRHGVAILLGFAVLGTGLALFGMTRTLPLAMIALGVVGFAAAVLNVFESVILQTRTADEMRGRAFAAVNALTQSLRPLSLAAAGGLLLFLSAPVVLIGCGVAVVLSGLGGACVRGVREL